MGSSKKKPASSGGAHSNLPPEVAAAKAELIDVENKRTALVEELRLVEKQVRGMEVMMNAKTSFFSFSTSSLSLSLLAPPHLSSTSKKKKDLRPRDALPRHRQPGRHRPQGLRRAPLVLRRGRRGRRRRRRRGRREEARRCQAGGARLFEVEHHGAASGGQVKKRRVFSSSSLARFALKTHQKL